MLGINDSDKPLKWSPERGRASQDIILDNHLPSGSKQALESSEHCCRVGEIVQGIGAGEEIKGCRWIG